MMSHGASGLSIAGDCPATRSGGLSPRAPKTRSVYRFLGFHIPPCFSARRAGTPLSPRRVFASGLVQGFNLVLLFALIIATIAYGLIREAHAEPWPKVAFAEWPRVTPSTITKPDAPLFRSDLPGSVQPKPRAPAPAPRLCNERQPLGYWLLVPCLVSSKDKGDL